MYVDTYVCKYLSKKIVKNYPSYIPVAIATCFIDHYSLHITTVPHIPNLIQIT